MGSILSNQEKEARKIREDLYQRVRIVKQKYKQDFTKISNQLKKQIALSSASQLVQMMDEERVTSEQILLCFIQRCCTIGIENNYIIDQLFEEALQQARKVDIERKKYRGKRCWKRGMRKQDCFAPFYGVPISLKETIILKNRQIYCGLVSKVNPIYQQDFLFVILLKQMGFIPFVRSNVSQGCKSIDTNNNIFGYARNPWRIGQSRSPGGSSGGQGGLLASGCSAIGVGTDIGGSLRVPAQWNGLYTIMANYRITRLGNGFYGTFAGGFFVKSVVGLLTKSTKDHLAILSFFCDQRNYKNIPKKSKDPYLNIKPFDFKYIEEEGQKSNAKLKIGFFTHLPTINCSKAHERAVRQCSQILERRGHSMIKIQMPEQFEELYFSMLKGIIGGAGDWILKQLSKKQKLTQQFKLLSISSRIPWFFKSIAVFLLKKISPRFARIIECSKPLSTKQYVALTYKVQVQLSKKIYNIFADNELDLILTPGFCFSAPKSGSLGKLQYTYMYSAPWNVIHYPVGAVPVTVVRNDQMVYEDEYNDIITKNIRKLAVEGSEGLPVGVQLASTPYNQQKILFIMGQLQEDLKFRQHHQYPI